MKSINLFKFIILTILSCAFATVFADNTTTTTGTTTSNDSFPSQTASSSNMNTDDSAITSNLQAAISSNHDLSKSHITIATQNGTVSLTGNINSSKLASFLVQIAASIAGVKDVDTSNLTVNHNPLLKDLATTAKVKGTFIREHLFGSKSLAKTIGVQTNNGVVTLTGKVANQSQADQAIQLTKSVSGVDTVQSKIIIKNKSTGY